MRLAVVGQGAVCARGEWSGSAGCKTSTRRTSFVERGRRDVSVFAEDRHDIFRDARVEAEVERDENELGAESGADVASQLGVKIDEGESGFCVLLRYESCHC